MKVNPNNYALESDALKALVQKFSGVQKSRLEEKTLHGREGWEIKEDMKRNLLSRIIDNLFEGDWVDVANLAMFAWNLNLKPSKCLE